MNVSPVTTYPVKDRFGDSDLADFTPFGIHTQASYVCTSFRESHSQQYFLHTMQVQTLRYAI